jgi:hypothetical protein
MVTETANHQDFIRITLTSSASESPCPGTRHQAQDFSFEIMPDSWQNKTVRAIFFVLRNLPLKLKEKKITS